MSWTSKTHIHKASLCCLFALLHQLLWNKHLRSASVTWLTHSNIMMSLLYSSYCALRVLWSPTRDRGSSFPAQNLQKMYNITNKNTDMSLIYENIYGNVFKLKRSLHYIQVNQNCFMSPTISLSLLYEYFCKTAMIYMIVPNKTLFSYLLFLFFLSRGHIRTILWSK